MAKHCLRVSPRCDPLSTVRVWAGLTALVLALAGCGNEFGRDDAIAAVRTTGVSEVESICIADSLLLLDQLDAANPGSERTETRRAALVSARDRCVDSEVLGESVEFEVSSPQEQTVSSEIESTDPEIQPPEIAPDSVEADNAAVEAVATLVLHGRSESQAQCIVDFLTDAQAIVLVSDPNFGLGLDPLEANAIAACLSAN